jgi:subtilisin family serine protease
LRGVVTGWRGCAVLILVGAWTVLPVRAGGVAPDLSERLRAAAPDDRIPIVVLIAEFPAPEDLLRGTTGLSRAHRRAVVVKRMKELAGESQRPVRDLLLAAGIESGETRLLWGINGVAVEAVPELVRDLAGLEAVRWVLLDREVDLAEAMDVDLERVLRERPPRPGRSPGPFPPRRYDGDGPTGGDASGPNPDAEVVGEVVALGARRVWEELGYTGEGTIVAVIDTGIDPDHPDLADHLWTNLDEIAGNGVDDDGNGFVDDVRGWDFCDRDNDPSDGTHGTQAAGQIAGDGTNGTVTGMAPDAELMPLGIRCGAVSNWWAASDYAIANGAHVISQSYSAKWVSGPDYEAFRRQAETELAAGIVHANSTGNTGTNPDNPVPYNVSAPGNAPPPWLHPDQRIVGGVSSVLGVADVSYSSNVIAATSPHGPAAWEDVRTWTDPDYPHDVSEGYRDYPYQNGARTGLLKPDLAAYGSGTTSTCPGATYCGFGGTSAATPRVAGALALMLSSNPEATPGELTEAILGSAVHRGEPGKNNRQGAGLLEAHGAVQSIEAVLRHHSHTVEDIAADAGNGDLSPDPGERLTLQVTLENVRQETTGPVEAILRTASSDVEIHDRFATFPPVPGGGTSGSDGPHFSFSLNGGTCASVVPMTLELRYDGLTRRTSFEIRVGEETEETFLNDAFESDSGWTADSMMATGGFWVREAPIGTRDELGDLANPERDSSENGSVCWVTGNGEMPGRKDVDNNDVDAGWVVLTSPPFGAQHLLFLEMVYDRWFYTRGEGGAADHFVVQVSNDGGATWTNADVTSTHEGVWTNRRIDLLGAVAPSDDMRVRFGVTDDGVDSTVEGAVDDVRVEGLRVDCDDHLPPVRRRPNGVGNTLRLGKTASGHLRIDWVKAPADPDHDPATVYRVLRALSGSEPGVEVGSATATRWFDVDALGAREDYFYVVIAENSGGRSDESP